MRKRQILIFFSVFFTLYAILNSYIFLRGWQAVPAPYHLVYTVAFAFFALAFIAGRLFERIKLSHFSSVLVWVGSYWLAAMAYLYIALVTVDLARLVNHVIPFFPAAVTDHPQEARAVTGIVIGAGVLIVLVLGHWNARRARVKPLQIAIGKNGRQRKTLNIVVASDIHLGTIIGKKRLDKIVATINALDPDLVLLPGDVVDEDIGPVIKQNLGETLRQIRSRYGVIAITGNHEYIGGAEPAVGYLAEHGIVVLRDQTMTIADSLVIVGREDLSRRGFAGEQRKSLREIMEGVDHTLPIILMDHQPFNLQEAVDQGVDLQLSGHTHHGQLWPFQFITKRMYEVSWGYKKKGNTHFYVSCGVGTWGPPVRIGNTPEIIQITFSLNGAT
jgi:uncharacterized protein